MSFKKEILKYEDSEEKKEYIVKNGEVAVILTAVHTMAQSKSDGSVKLNEPFTKGIAKYVAEKVNAHSFIKVLDTGIDSNSLLEEDFKIQLLDIIKKNNIKLLIDLHGAKKDRNFDVEFGTLNNLSADFSTVRELEDSFCKHGVKNIEHNTNFKGGGITQYIYGKTDIDIIQLEINGKYRSINDINNIEKICNSIVDFIKKYSNLN